ncbi:Os10g0414601 [Oryza sativa Japonica Group]|jgi:hypothetical protein|uniref:Os10g0414601 protein n=1 Tax=Oryza sativa subsp. japonica TaxID=39947 RepID=A0A0P0XUP2_ORYSJ|nr:Os10g0414601 [Oryza sativa Japonica Group]
MEATTDGKKMEAIYHPQGIPQALSFVPRRGRRLVRRRDRKATIDVAWWVVMTMTVVIWRRMMANNSRDEDDS